MLGLAIKLATRPAHLILEIITLKYLVNGQIYEFLIMKSFPHFFQFLYFTPQNKQNVV
jgi:hypothetical protein